MLQLSSVSVSPLFWTRFGTRLGIVCNLFYWICQDSANVFRMNSEVGRPCSENNYNCFRVPWLALFNKNDKWPISIVRSLSWLYPAHEHNDLPSDSNTNHIPMSLFGSRKADSSSNRIPLSPFGSRNDNIEHDRLSNTVIHTWFCHLMKYMRSFLSVNPFGPRQYSNDSVKQKRRSFRHFPQSPIVAPRSQAHFGTNTFRVIKSTKDVPMPAGVLPTLRRARRLEAVEELAASENSSGNNSAYKFTLGDKPV